MGFWAVLYIKNRLENQNLESPGKARLIKFFKESKMESLVKRKKIFYLQWRIGRKLKKRSLQMSSYIKFS